MIIALAAAPFPPHRRNFTWSRYSAYCMLIIMATVKSDFDLIFATLGKHSVRYLVVGGVAVVLHGHPRFTADLDLVVALDRPNATAAIHALATLGYHPRPPVPAMDFTDPVKREEWIREKDLTVLGLWSPDFPATEIDLFVAEPFPFDLAYERRTCAAIGANSISVASIQDLIALKTKAGRPKDLEDIRALQAILAHQENHG